MNLLDQNLDERELDELHAFLASPGLAETSLDIVGLDGFCAAIVSAPRLAMPSEWTPWVWDVERGEVSPEFEDLAQAERILGLVMRFYNSVATALLEAPVEFAPLFEPDDHDAASAWCGGFLAGMRFDLDAWHALVEEKPKWFAPIFGLGFEDEGGPRPRKAQLQRWAEAVGPAVAKIHGHGLDRRQARPPGTTADDFSAGSGPATPRAAAAPGRNDLCPCGSGKKFKRCCGARGA